MKVSLVIIGRNDEQVLRKIYSEAYVQVIKRNFNDVVYVDSASTDQSVGFMISCGFRCFAIKDISSCTAASGRNVGAKEATGDYVLFLDSDMKIESLDESMGLLFSKLQETLVGNYAIVGAVGQVKDIYPNGATRLRVRRCHDGEVAHSFGGAILIKRRCILDVGNWRPDLVANEELDLQIRLSKINKKILFFKEFKILHFTRKISKWDELMSLYIPGKSIRYGSWGRLLRAQDDRNSIYRIIQLNIEVILLPLVILVLSLNVNLGIVAFLVYEMLLVRKKSILYNAVVPGVCISMIVGLFLRPVRSKDVEYEKI